MSINYTGNNFGNIELADGTHIRLTQQAYNDNAPDGSPAWFAAGHLSTENAAEETGPTVKVMWASLGADEGGDDADWGNPASARHYSRGELFLA
jgi:hypothetical protein